MTDTCTKVPDEAFLDWHVKRRDLKAMKNRISLKPMTLLDKNARLAETNAVVWFLGFGVGGATGLALAYALFACAPFTL